MLLYMWFKKIARTCHNAVYKHWRYQTTITFVIRTFKCLPISMYNYNIYIAIIPFFNLRVLRGDCARGTVPLVVKSKLVLNETPEVMWWAWCLDTSVLSETLNKETMHSNTLPM